MAQIFGIDLSADTGDFNLLAVRNDKKPGFAIICIGGNDIGSRRLYQDRKFKTWYNVFRENNIPVGAYFKAGAVDVKTSDVEVAYIRGLIQECSFEYPIYYDISDLVGLRPRRVTSIVNNVMRKLRSVGYMPGICVPVDSIETCVFDAELGDISRWIKCWTVQEPVLSSKFAVNIWQYGGELNQIRSNTLGGTLINQDYDLTDYATLMPRLKLNGFGNKIKYLTEEEAMILPEENRPSIILGKEGDNGTPSVITASVSTEKTHLNVDTSDVIKKGDVEYVKADDKVQEVLKYLASKGLDITEFTKMAEKAMPGITTPVAQEDKKVEPAVEEIVTPVKVEPVREVETVNTKKESYPSSGIILNGNSSSTYPETRVVNEVPQSGSVTAKPVNDINISLEDPDNVRANGVNIPIENGYQPVKDTVEDDIKQYVDALQETKPASENETTVYLNKNIEVVDDTDKKSQTQVVDKKNDNIHTALDLYIVPVERVNMNATNLNITNGTIVKVSEIYLTSNMTYGIKADMLKRDFGVITMIDSNAGIIELDYGQMYAYIKDIMAIANWTNIER